MLSSARPARRAVMGAIGTGALAGAMLFGAAATATAQPPFPPPCTAAELARVMSGVTFDTSNYLSTHPDVNDFFTSLKGQPRDQIRDQVQTYLDANPQVRDELQRHPATLGRLPPTLWGPGDPLTVSAARFVAQGRSVVGASVDGIACAPTDLVGLKMSALLGGGYPLAVVWPRGGTARSRLARYPASRPEPRPDHVPRSIESKTLSDCSNGAEVTPSWFPKGWSSQ